MSRVIDRGNFRHGSSTSTSTRGAVFPANFRSVRSPPPTTNSHERSNFQRNYGKEWLMERPNYQRQIPNFVIELQLGHRSVSKAEVEGLLKECTSRVSYDRLCVSPSSSVPATLSFRQWNDAFEVFVFFWSKRLEGAHDLKPNLICNVFVPSDKDEIRVRLKDLFVARVRGLLEGEEVQRWKKRVDACSDEIVKVQSLLKRKYNKIGTFYELQGKKDGFVAERELIMKRLQEFESAMNCILGFLEGLHFDEVEEVEVLSLPSEFDWNRILSMMIRECRRLEEGLPIYAQRRKILQEIHCQQVHCSTETIVDLELNYAERRKTR